MTVNLTPSIQMEIYKDKQSAYLMEMLDKLTPKIEYKSEETQEKKDDQTKKDDKNEFGQKKEPLIKESSFGYNSYMQTKHLNNTISTKSFFDTVSKVHNNVKEYKTS